MSDNVLFLDFDGPLYPDRYIRVHSKQRKIPASVKEIESITYWMMDPMSVHMLNQLYDIHKFKTVVSSTWRKFGTKEHMENLFAENDLQLKLHDQWATPILHYGCRHAEINLWLEEYGCDDYLILDDNDSGPQLDIIMDSNKVVLVDCEFGISTRHFIKMLDIVAKWEGIKIPPSSSKLW